MPLVVLFYYLVPLRRMYCQNTWPRRRRGVNLLWSVYSKPCGRFGWTGMMGRRYQVAVILLCQSSCLGRLYMVRAAAFQHEDMAPHGRGLRQRIRPSLCEWHLILPGSLPTCFPTDFKFTLLSASKLCFWFVKGCWGDAGWRWMPHTETTNWFIKTRRAMWVPRMLSSQKPKMSFRRAFRLESELQITLATLGLIIPPLCWCSYSVTLHDVAAA